MSDVAQPTTPAQPQAAQTTEGKAETKQETTAAPAASSEQTHKNTMAKAVEEVLGADEDSGEAEEGEEAIDANKEMSAKEKKEAKRLWKLKVGGKDLDVDEAELVKRAQMGYSADQKWQEASQMRKQMEAFLTVLQNDPAEALAQLGMNVDDLAERHIQRRIEEMQKSPEQVEREKLQKEVEKLRKEAQTREDHAREIQKQQLQQQFAVEFETDILSSLEDPSSGLPKSPYFIKRIADTMIFGMQNGFPNMKAKDAINIIKDEVKKELREMYTASPDDLFEELIGKDRLTKYRKGKIKKPKSPTAPAEVKATGKAELQATEEKGEQQRIKARDFFRNLGSR